MINEEKFQYPMQNIVDYMYIYITRLCMDLLLILSCLWWWAPVARTVSISQ